MAKKRGETQRLYLESVVATLTGWNDPQTRLQQAFENDEFILFGHIQGYGVAKPEPLAGAAPK